jgi:alcohol dehydrogenase class IV
MSDTVLAWNQEAVPARFEELAHAAGVAGGGPAFVPWLRTLKRELGIPASLSAAGVRREQVARLVEVASADVCHQTNPRPCAAADFERFFLQAL